MAQNLTIELNGNLIQGRIDGADNFQITYRRADETGKLSQSYSSELTFYDDGYQMLKQNLIDNPKTTRGFEKDSIMVGTATAFSRDFGLLFFSAFRLFCHFPSL